MNKQTRQVLHVTIKLSFGGTGKMISSWIHNIDDEKFKCDLVHQGIVNEHAQRQADELQALGVRIYGMPFRYRHMYKRYKFIKNIIKNNRYDVVHVHTSSPFDVITLVAAKHCGVKTRIMHSHNSNNHLDSPAKKITGALAQFLARGYSSHMVGCSQEAGLSLFGNTNYVRENLIVVNNGVDTSLFRFDKLKRRNMRNTLKVNGKHVFGHVGRFSKEKNQRFIIDIFNEIKKLKNNVVLLLVGEGDLKNQCIQKVQKLGLSEDVLFLGNVDNVVDYFQAMDTLLFPSLWEGFGVVLIEAQCCGLPCLVSNAIVNDAIITEYVTKYSLDASSLEWAKKALEIINDDEVRGDAYLTVEQKGFAIKNNIEVFQQLYS